MGTEWLFFSQPVQQIVNAVARCLDTVVVFVGLLDGDVEVEVDYSPQLNPVAKKGVFPFCKIKGDGVCLATAFFDAGLRKPIHIVVVLGETMVIKGKDLDFSKVRSFHLFDGIAWEKLAEDNAWSVSANFVLAVILVEKQKHVFA